MKKYVIEEYVLDVNVYESEGSSRGEALLNHYRGSSSLVSGPFTTDQVQLADKYGVPLDEKNQDIADYFKEHGEEYKDLHRWGRLPSIRSIKEAR